MKPFPLVLLANIMRTAPFQPATNLWRAVELDFLIDQALPLLRESRAVLDLGCGDGEIMRLLSPHLPVDALITGVDVDPEETALARARGFYTQVKCEKAENMAFEEGSFDAIISNSVLEHIPDLDAVLAQGSRVLKKGGWLIATVPSDGFHGCLKGSWLPWVTHEAYCQHIDARLAHCRYWSQREWQDHLARVGMKLVEAKPYLNRSETNRWEFLSRITGGFLYYLGGCRQKPIQLQRRLGMRRERTLPLWLARAFAYMIAFGLGNDSSQHACYLIVAQKE